MSEKLTLSLDSELMEFASGFSQKINKPISRIIEDYFIELREENSDGLPHDLQELYGIFEGADIPDKKEMRRLFYEKRGD